MTHQTTTYINLMQLNQLKEKLLTYPKVKAAYGSLTPEFDRFRQILKAEKKMTSKYKLGDTVYPCYDGKISRHTACTVTEVLEPSKIKVKGQFWGDAVKDRTLEVVFENGEAEVAYDVGLTLMQLLGAAEEGDFYRLHTEEEMEKFWEYLNRSR